MKQCTLRQYPAHASITDLVGFYLGSFCMEEATCIWEPLRNYQQIATFLSFLLLVKGVSQ